MYFKEINEKLIELSLFKVTSTLTYHIESILKHYSYEKLKELENIIENNIVRYFEEELDRKVEDLKECCKYGGWYDPDGYWQNEYEEYFEFDCDGGMFPREWKIINDFDIPCREGEEDYATLEWLLEIGDFNCNNINAMNFEIMAVQAVIYLKNLCSEPSNISHLSNAYLALRSSEKLSTNFDIECELLKAKQKARKEVTEKATKKRHQESRKMEALVIQRWLRYKKTKAEQGKVASKNAFAKKIFDELDEAHKKNPDVNKSYSFKTIRNNWLQGRD